MGAVFLAAHELLGLTDLQQPTLTGELEAAAAALVMQSATFLAARAQRVLVKTGPTHLADQRQPLQKQELRLDMAVAGVAVAERQPLAALDIWAAAAAAAVGRTLLALHLALAALAELAIFSSFQFR